MRNADLVARLSAVLPGIVDDFSDSSVVSSLTRSGTTVTITTTSAHELSIGQQAVIKGAETPITISVLTRSGIVGSMDTATDHDATIGEFITVTIVGATEPEFNGDFDIIAIPNRKKIQFRMVNSGPTVATGSPIVTNVSSPLQSYNGLKRVDAVPTPTTFEYTVTDSTMFTPASGDISVKSNPRISAAVTVERAIASYTKQDSGDAWLFVVVGDMVANKSRRLDLDASENLNRTSFFKQYASQEVQLLVFLPTANEISGRIARDRAEELLQPICQSVLFAKFDSLLANGSYNALMFLSSGFLGYDTATYIHSYGFEMLLLFGFEDTVGFDEDVALRDIEVSQFSNAGIDPLESNIDLDSEPLS